VLVTSFSDDRRQAALEAAARAGGGIRPATSAGTTTVTRLLGAVSVRSRPLARRILQGVDALQVPERHRRFDRSRRPRALDPALTDRDNRPSVPQRVRLRLT
jgi:glycerophosphoryl diester phosphodiesterase